MSFCFTCMKLVIRSISRLLTSYYYPSTQRVGLCGRLCTVHVTRLCDLFTIYELAVDIRLPSALVGAIPLGHKQPLTWNKDTAALAPRLKSENNNIMEKESTEQDANLPYHTMAKVLELRTNSDLAPTPALPDLIAHGSTASELRHQHPSFRRLSGLVPSQRSGGRRSPSRFEPMEVEDQTDSGTATPLTRHNSFLYGSHTRRRSLLAPRTAADEDTDDHTVTMLSRSHSHAVISSAALMPSRASSANAQNSRPVETLISAYQSAALSGSPSPLPYSQRPQPRPRRLSMPPPLPAAAPAASAASSTSTAPLMPPVTPAAMAALLRPRHPFVHEGGARPATSPGGRGGDLQPCRNPVVHSVLSTLHRPVSCAVVQQPSAPVQLMPVQQALTVAPARSGLVAIDLRAASSVDRDLHGTINSEFGLLTNSAHAGNGRGSSGGSLRRSPGRDTAPIPCPSPLSRLPTPPRHVPSTPMTTIPPALLPASLPPSPPPARSTTAPYIPARSCGFRPLSCGGPYMRAFHLSWASLCLAFFSSFAPAAMLPVVAEDLGLSKPVVAAAGATSLAASIITRLFMGAAVRRYGPRYCQALILLLTATPLACMALVNSAAGFIAARFVISACLGTFVVSNFWVILMFHPLVLGAAAATCTSLGNAGSGLPMILMPLLYEGMKKLYDGDIRSTWKAVFYIPAGVHLLLACITLLLGQDTSQGDLLDWEAHEERSEAPWDPNMSTHKRQQQHQQQRRKQTLQQQIQIQLQLQQLQLRMTQEQQQLRQREVRACVSGGSGYGGQRNSGSGSARRVHQSFSQSRRSPQQSLNPQLPQSQPQHQISGFEEAATAGWQANLERIRIESASLRGWARQRGSSGGPVAVACGDGGHVEDQGLSSQAMEGSSFELWHGAERIGPRMGLGLSSRNLMGTGSVGWWGRSWGGGHSPGCRRASLPVAEGVEGRVDSTLDLGVDRGCGSGSGSVGLGVETAQCTRSGDGDGGRAAASGEWRPTAAVAATAAAVVPASCPRAALISSFATTRPSPLPPSLAQPTPPQTTRSVERAAMANGSRCGDSAAGDAYTEWLRRRLRQHNTLGAGWREAARLYGLALRNSRCMLLSLNYGYNFGAQMALYNILTLYLVREYGMSFIAGGGLAAMPGLFSMCSRVSGCFLSDWMCRRFGMRGRLWLLWVSQCAGGVFCLLMGITSRGPSGLAATSVLLLLFALATQIAAGTTFTITPYVSYRAFSAVLGIVSAGGQLGGALLLALFFAPNTLTYQQGLIWMGISILIVSNSLAFVRFPMWGSMLTGPDKRHGGVQEEQYYLAEWTPEEQDAGIAAPALSFAMFARSERSDWSYGVDQQPLGRL